MTMKKNPGMKVLYRQGYFDLATPALATKFYKDHMDITPKLSDNIRLELYVAGPMMYIDEPSLVKFKPDLASFIRNSCFLPN